MKKIAISLAAMLMLTTLAGTALFVRAAQTEVKVVIEGVYTESGYIAAGLESTGSFTTGEPEEDILNEQDVEELAEEDVMEERGSATVKERPVFTHEELLQRRNRIAGRQADIRDGSMTQIIHGAAEPEISPEAIARKLPSSGVAVTLLILSVSTACGLVAVGVKKFRKNM